MYETLVNSVFLAVTEHTTAEPASEPEPETELLPPNSISELPEKLLDSGVYLPGRYIPPPPSPLCTSARPSARLSIFPDA